jgi:hypothetical protein
LSAGGLRIGETNDVYEQEADRAAEEVVTASAGRSHWSLPTLSSAPPLQRKCSCGSSGGSGGECEECKQKKEQTLQRKAAGPAGPAMAPPVVHDVLNSPGQPLDKATRDYFEPRFGYDFSRIRVHTDATARTSATAVQALAYTVGSHIVFNDGRYAPTGIEGRKLLAHELAHTVQQRRGLFRKTPPDRPLPPHDPTASAPAAGACYGSAICKDLKRPSKLLAEAKDDPANKTKRDQRKQACNKRPPEAACIADGHGAPATQAQSLLKAYDASRPPAGVKLVVDRDMEQDFGALTIKCANFVPPITGATDCITIPEQMEKEATQFNTTADKSIGGMERGKWRERTLEILVHESEHTRFRAAFRGNTLLATLPGCANTDAVSAMNELAAMLTEFRLRMERIRGSVALSSEDRAKEMNEWRDHRIRGTEQSITVSLRTVRCVCQCDDANKMIRETIEFATSSWTQQEKNDLHREIRDPRWNDLDLRWPFVAPAIPSVHGP